jgi:hypothetical protein
MEFLPRCILFREKISDSARAKVLLEQKFARAKNQNFYFYDFYVSFYQTSCFKAFKIGFKIKKNFARARKNFSRAKILLEQKIFYF